MGITIGAIALISGLVAAFGSAKGFDYRKRSNWLYIACGFLFGLLLAGGLAAGIFVAVFTLWGGTYMFQVKQRFRE